MKTCNTCGKSKNEDDFYIDKREKDGHRHACKLCTREARKKSYIKNHAAEIERSRKWKRENHGKQIQYNAHWRQLNPTKAVLHARKWQISNPGKVADIKARRRMSGACKWSDKKKIAEVYEFAKEFRDAGFDVHVDHIIPIRGLTVSGLHVEQNLRVCLETANLRKGNRQMEHFQ